MAKAKNRRENAAKKKSQQSKAERLGLGKIQMSVGELHKAMKKAQYHCDRDEWDKALPHLLTAWDAMPEDLAILTLLSQGLARLGVRDKAIMVLERTLAIHGETPEICGIMFSLSMEMGMHSVAVKLCQRLIDLEPTTVRHYVNLASALSGLKQLDESIHMLKNVIPLFPESSDLWNVLATQVRARDGAVAANVFFEEAMRLAPHDYKIFSNYGQSLLMQGQYDTALDVYQTAIELNPDSPEPRLGAAQLMFLKGRFEEGWKNYEYRLSTRRASNQTQIYTHGLPAWAGEPLAGKTLMVVPEQGIGDEIMWGNILPYLYEQAEKLIIGCDHRLVSIYQRRFPNAHVERYYDRMHQGYRYRSLPFVQKMMADGEISVDFAITIGSAPKFYWHSAEEVRPHSDGFLQADPDRKAEIQHRLAEISDKPKVALAWRSGLMTSDRAFIYGSVDVLGPLFELGDRVDFINVQYGNVAEELDAIKERYGVKVHNFTDINLKDDIEANLAIMDSCDLVITSASAPGQFSMALGAPTIIMTGSEVWWTFGCKDKVLFAKDAEVIASPGEIDWADIVQRVKARAKERLGL